MALPSSYKRRLTITAPPILSPPVPVSPGEVPAGIPVLRAPAGAPAPLAPDIPQLAPRSATSISGPTLPVPGHSGLGWVRDALPLGRVKPTAPPRAGRGAPTTVTRPGRVAPGTLPFVTPTEEDAGDPSAPTTAEPLRRFAAPPSDRHGRMYPRLQDVGGFRPWFGKRFPMLDGRPGGVPQLPAPVRHGMALPDPAGGPQRAKWTELQKTIAQIRRWQKPETILRSGVGGLDVAMGPRWKPGTPDGRKDLLRDVRSGKWRQSWPDGTVPSEMIDRLGRMRAAIGGVPTATVPASTPVSTLPTVEAPAEAPSASGIMTMVPMPPGLTATTGGPTTSDAPTSKAPVLGIAAALALFWFLK